MALVYREAMKVLADILANGFSLVGKYVVLYNERRAIPSDYQGLYIILSIISTKIIGVVNRPQDKESGLSQVQGVTKNEMIQIDIMSEDSTARERNQEVIIYLNSLYAQQQCELYNIKIARIPLQINDLSELEGSSRINRYGITINVKSAFNKVVDAEYYNDFSRAVPPTTWVDVKP